MQPVVKRVSQLTGVSQLGRAVETEKTDFCERVRSVALQNASTTSKQAIFNGTEVLTKLLCTNKKEEDHKALKVLVSFIGKKHNCTDIPRFKEAFKEAFKEVQVPTFVTDEELLSLIQSPPPDSSKFFGGMLSFGLGGISGKILEGKAFRENLDDKGTMVVSFDPAKRPCATISGPMPNRSAKIDSLESPCGIKANAELTRMQDGLIQACTGNITGGALHEALIVYCRVDSNSVTVSITHSNGVFECNYMDTRARATRTGETPSTDSSDQPEEVKWVCRTTTDVSATNPFIYTPESVILQKCNDGKLTINSVMWNGGMNREFFGIRCEISTMMVEGVNVSATNETMSCVFKPSAAALLMFGVTECRYSKYADSREPAHRVTLTTSHGDFVSAAPGLNIFSTSDTQRVPSLKFKRDSDASGTEEAAIFMDGVSRTSASNIVLNIPGFGEVAFKWTNVTNNRVVSFEIEDRKFLDRFGLGGITSIKFNDNTVTIATSTETYTKQFSTPIDCNVGSLISALPGSYTTAATTGTPSTLDIAIPVDNSTVTATLKDNNFAINGLKLPWQQITFVNGKAVNGIVDLAKLPNDDALSSLKHFATKMTLENGVLKLECGTQKYSVSTIEENGSLHFTPEIPRTEVEVALDSAAPAASVVMPSNTGATETAAYIRTAAVTEMADEVTEGIPVVVGEAAPASSEIVVEIVVMLTGVRFCNTPYVLNCSGLSFTYGTTRYEATLQQTVVLHSTDDAITFTGDKYTISVNPQTGLISKLEGIVPLSVATPIYLANFTTKLNPCLIKFSGSFNGGKVSLSDLSVSFTQVESPSHAMHELAMSEEGEPIVVLSQVVHSAVETVRAMDTMRADLASELSSAKERRAQLNKTIKDRSAVDTLHKKTENILSESSGLYLETMINMADIYAKSAENLGKILVGDAVEHSNNLVRRAEMTSQGNITNSMQLRIQAASQVQQLETLLKSARTDRIVAADELRKVQDQRKALIEEQNRFTADKDEFNSNRSRLEQDKEYVRAKEHELRTLEDDLVKTLGIVKEKETELEIRLGQLSDAMNKHLAAASSQPGSRDTSVTRAENNN